MVGRTGVADAGRCWRWWLARSSLPRNRSMRAAVFLLFRTNTTALARTRIFPASLNEMVASTLDPGNHGLSSDMYLLVSCFRSLIGLHP